MSLLAEMKRRNVAKMAVLYVVASWLVLQVADVLFDALELPSSWDRLVLAFVILGFPLVLIFSWIFEMTPEGIKRESQVDRGQSVTAETGRKMNLAIVVLLVLAIIAVGADRLMPEATITAERSTQNSSPQINADDVVPELSIAVLPFANRSAEEDDVYFVDGIHDDILTQLAHIQALTVTSRTSVERFREVSQQGIREIAAILGVRNILEGGVQRSGDRIRINVQLIDVTNDGHLWAETFERELTASNLFAVQGEIAAAVAEALRVALLDEEALALDETPTESLEAYDLYLLGRYHWRQLTEESLHLAKDYFEQAIGEDPEYVLALSGLADSNMMLVFYGNLDGDVAFPIAQESIDKAMKIDAAVSEVWASLGLMRLIQVDQEGAAEALLRAIELDDGNSSAWLWYGLTLENMRRHEEALRALETSYSLEPMTKPVNNYLWQAYFRRGDFVRARQHLERSVQLDEEQANALRNQIADMYYYAGNHTKAIELYRRILKDDPGNGYALEGVGWSYLALGDISEARDWFLRAERVNTWSQNMYWVFEAEEDYEGAIVYLEDKLSRDPSRRNLQALHFLFRASYLGDNLLLARAYISELLETLNDRFEIDPSNTDPLQNLLVATFLMQHGDADGVDAQRGRKMLDDIHAGLLSLREQGFRRPMTLAGLAVSYALKGDSLAAYGSMNEAIDLGYRNYQIVLNQPAFDGLGDSADFVAVTERIRKLMADDRARLEQTVLESYSPPAERQPIAVSREKLREYEGHYSNGNVLFHFFVGDDGVFSFKPGQEIAEPVVAFAENLFFLPKASNSTFQFVANERGEITHVLYSESGATGRFKAVPPPPPAIQLDVAVLNRYEGTFVHDRLSRANEENRESDSWTGVIRVDEEGTVWLDFDNQPKLVIIPFAESEFYLPGFDTTLTFVINPETGNFDRINYVVDGTVLVFNRQ